MAEILHFSPHLHWPAKQNLEAFVNVCRSQLTVFGPDLAFDEDVWDVTKYINLKGKRSKTKLRFTLWGEGKRGRGCPMPEPFKSFAKSYIRYQQGLRPSKSLETRLAALRALYVALSEKGDKPDPTTLHSFHFNRAAQLISERISKSSSYQYGVQLQLISEMMVSSGLLQNPNTWRSHIQRSVGCEKVGAEFDAIRLARLPSPTALSALASIFNIATEPSDILITSIIAILCAAPERINEVVRLAVDSEIIQRKAAGSGEVYGLRWFPSKGAAPHVKWVVPSMENVVKKAILNIKRISASARDLAEWYEINPGKIFLPEELEYLRNRKYLTKDELACVLFCKPVARAVINNWCSSHKLVTWGVGNKICVLFEDIERVVLGMLPLGFPIADRDHGLKYSGMLCLVRLNGLHSTRAKYRCMFMRLGVADVNIRISAKSHLSKSIFEKYGFREPDGSPISVSTHKFRHYLNTLAQFGGLSQIDIALWSGRARVSENTVYDHVSNRDVLELVRAAVGDSEKPKGPLARLRHSDLIDRNEFTKLNIPTAHSTDFGYCVHDFSLLPCQAHQDCLNCREHLCVKGDPEKERRIKILIHETQDLLLKAEQAESEKLAGAHRWVEHQKHTLQRAEQLIQILEDPVLPQGSVIRMSTPVMPSRLAMAMRERQSLIRFEPDSSPNANRQRRRS